MSGRKLSLVLLLLIVGGSTITQCARPPPIICAAVLCAKPDCPYPLPPPKGQCCPICPPKPPTDPPKPDCRLVDCAKPTCPRPLPPPKGKCCPFCKQDCRLVRCAAPVCPKPLPPRRGECCPFCKQDCRVVLCAKPNCPDPLPPPRGECCPRCPDGCNYNGKFYKRGSSFPADDGCNTCYCLGKDRVICTKRACPKVCKFNGKIYKPGDSFPAGDGCNTCSCRSSGRVVCTLIACPVQCKFNGKLFDVGDTFPAGDGCNTCTCTEDGTVACTEIACVVRCKYNGKYYDPGDSFPSKDGCNTCTCSKNGNVACTERLCLCPVKGQVFTQCGSACPPTCAKPNPICTLQCVPGCECPRGTVIDEATNSCVRPEKCTCPVKGQVFTECGSACPANCTNPNPPCTLQCVARCECPRGTVIDEATNSCVRPEKCTCPVKGQIFKQCGSACPPNCTDPNPICTRQCVPRCECPRGTVIDEVTNTCVPPKECPPPPCPPDKPRVNCFVDPCMFAKCRAHPNAKCVADYCGGCFARFFDRKGNEVTDSCDCPPTQVFNTCGSACTPTCKKPNPICSLQCVARCECPRNTVLNTATGKCVHIRDCPGKKG